MNYFEDFYHEPSEFEMKMDELKRSLLDSVREEYVTEMDLLRKENEELQEVKKNMEQIKREYSDKKQELNFERQKLLSVLRRERLSALFKDSENIMFKPTSTGTKLPKCEKCNSKRQITYKTPLGKDAYEMCDCNKSKYEYQPSEYIAIEMRIDRNKTGMTAFYKLKPQSNDDDDYLSYQSSTLLEVIYNEGMKYEDLTKSRTFFRTEEECQKYCDYLNSKEND